MRTVPAAPVPPGLISVPAGRGHASPTVIVCAALMLALAFLALRIAGVVGGPLSFPDCSFIGDSVGANCPIPEIRAGQSPP